MKLLILILLSMFCTSCAINPKFGKKDYFKQKYFNLDGQYSKTQMLYYSTTENDQHCFESNPKNKEIITVATGHLHFAIDHFYKRVAKVNVIQRKTIDGIRYDVNYTESANFDLEIANCYFERSYGFADDFNQEYTSFRLKD